MPSWLWTWEGACFGYRDGDDLWTRDGRHAGRFHGEEVFAPTGAYLGEVHDGRLITRSAKVGRREAAFMPRDRAPARAPHLVYAPYAMPEGYQSFPGPDAPGP